MRALIAALILAGLAAGARADTLCPDGSFAPGDLLFVVRRLVRDRRPEDAARCRLRRRPHRRISAAL